MTLADETRDIREPISPELVLVDAELAAAARAVLPDYTEDYPRAAQRPVERADQVPSLVEAPAPQPPTEPPTWVDDNEVELDTWERKAPSRRIRTAVAAAAVALFALSALAVRSWRESASNPGATPGSGTRPSSVNGRGAPPAPAQTRKGETVPAKTAPTGSETTQPTETAEPPPAPPPPPPPPPAPSRPPPPPVAGGRPPGNVLGVIVTAGRHRVTLQWQRPAGAVAVIILRRPGRHGAESTIYEGARNTYVDRTVRNQVAYRYLIISRDRKGRLSSGVPSVVTPSWRS